MPQDIQSPWLARILLQLLTYATHSFFNTVWLVLNDVTIGIAFGTFLSENHHALAYIINTYAERFLVEEIKWALIWLDSWPAGLKLNTELSRFYSHTFIGLVDIFAREYSVFSVASVMNL